MTTHGQCDACGKIRSLTQLWCFGIETYACAECRHDDPDAYEYSESTTPQVDDELFDAVAHVYFEDLP